MSNTTLPDPSTWDGMSFTELFDVRAQMVAAMREQVEDLLRLSEVLKKKAREQGLGLTFNYSELVPIVERLTKASETATAAPSRSGKGVRKPYRYQLVWRKDLSPVTDEDGQPLMFKSQLQKLRGPRYEALLGAKVKDVCLVDTFQGNQVTVETLTLGPAPGRDRG